ncbi:MAG: glycosyltransferase family 2 protein [Flavobacterium sp.]|nr:glycosyltransferase family 2 protein [Flavobacterium sp.]
MKGKVYILILNYQTWADTIECLESVLMLDYPNYQVIVVDNNSPNDSMEYIKAWAEGKLDIWTKINNPLRHLSHPLSSKPIPYVFYDRQETEKGENRNSESKHKNPLILIQTGHNKGFASGNNVGIKYALIKDDFEYIWILNNDTVVERDSLAKLVEKAQEYKKQNKKVGIIGSKLLYYDNPKIINGVAGVYNKWFGVSKQIGVFEEDNGQYDNEIFLDKIDYVIGASMFTNKDFLKDVGLMCEDYFLFYEELDWTQRAKKKNYHLGYCWLSKIYHKEGGTIGSSSKGKEKSELADYYFFKNRIVFTKKFFPNYLWSIYLGFLITIFNRIKRGQFERIKIIFEIIFKR